jgi:rubrerythrin
MEDFDLDAYVSRSRALDLSALAWEDVPHHPLSPAAVRTLRYMQDIESHTIVYLRTLLSTRAIDDPEVATFLACWLYEETFHGRALARFLEAAGETTVQRARSRASLAQRGEAALTALVARAWPDFVAVHMTWGAINELTTLTGYQQLAAAAGHPILSELLARIIRDESRHFFFYFRQAERRLRSPGTARVTRFLVDRFWAPVGSGVQPACETRLLAAYLFSGAEGRAVARKVDATIRRLPGFADVRLLEAWIEREIGGAARSVASAPTRKGTPESGTDAVRSVMDSPDSRPAGLGTPVAAGHPSR